MEEDEHDGRSVEELLRDEHETPIDDQVAADEDLVCGYCGRAFMGSEARIERVIYGQKWVFCSDECYESFRDASNFTADEPDMIIEEEDTGFEIDMTFSGPEYSDDEE